MYFDTSWFGTIRSVDVRPAEKPKLVRAIITADMRRSNAVIFRINYNCDLRL